MRISGRRAGLAGTLAAPVWQNARVAVLVKVPLGWKLGMGASLRAGASTGMDALLRAHASLWVGASLEPDASLRMVSPLGLESSRGTQPFLELEPSLKKDLSVLIHRRNDQFWGRCGSLPDGRGTDASAHLALEAAGTDILSEACQKRSDMAAIGTPKSRHRSDLEHSGRLLEKDGVHRRPCERECRTLLEENIESWYREWLETARKLGRRALAEGSTRLLE